MKVTSAIHETRATCGEFSRVAFVPTMGALHEGHVALMRRAKELCPFVVVSIFVNPTQFGPNEDFTRYPRPIERDLEMCRAAGVDHVFLPAVEDIYPPGELETTIDVPAITKLLEGEHRPGHFVGVCRVVTKLLNIVKPQVACFGMKDYQQLAVIRAMVAGMSMGVRIEPCETVREPDGLAMSSRNVYLTADQRRDALGLHKALNEAKKLIQSGERDPLRVEAAMRKIIEEHSFEIDYAVVRHTQTLQPVPTLHPPVVCLLAARIGNVRLLDNAVIAPPGS